ncbi:hypothetical protein BGZ83_002348 [Gryganskiella cystojenkinii]|nr:hypothetical protein BGZ83_002348 [Gryganskiella cystojenkinii]
MERIITGNIGTFELAAMPFASGHFADVFHATRVGDNDTKYCCKVIDMVSRPFNQDEREAIDMEVSIVRTVHHANIINFIDVHLTKNFIYIVTELAEGSTLIEYERNNNHYLTEIDSRHIFKQLCEAVAYLHNMGVIHRDIKSENIMVDDNLKVTLIDFGLARFSNGKAVLTTHCGTFPYMAPEVELGEERNGYGAAADIWSLGVVLFKMLVGKYPFDDELYQDVSQEKDAIEENLGGSERKKQSYFNRDWRPHVDRLSKRSPQAKELLESMLTVDPSRRARIDQILRFDWMRILDEVLESFDNIEGSSTRILKSDDSLSGIGSTSADAPAEPWGELTVVPGSMLDGPRHIELSKDVTCFGRKNIEKLELELDVVLGSHRGISTKHCYIERDANGVVMVSDIREHKFKNRGELKDKEPRLIWDDKPTWGVLMPLNPLTQKKEELQEHRISIGRDKIANDIVVSNTWVSRVHCILEWSSMERKAYLENMSPTHETLVNEVPFEGRLQLRDKDIIHLVNMKADNHEEKHRIGYHFRLVDKDTLPKRKKLKHNSEEDIDIASEVDLVVSAYPVQDDGLDEELLAADHTSQQYQEIEIPEVVKNFILYFHRNVTENNVHELHAIYEHSFNKLTEKFYAKESWPEPEAISALVNDDQVFLTLYRELFYRHIYSRLTPTIEHRFHSYENYCDLFNYILNSEGPVSLELPNQWLWDIIDEFIYQFQSFCNYRNRIKNKSEEELAFLRDNSQIWSCYSVLNVLYSLIQKSRITEQLLVSKNGGDMVEAAGEYGSRPLYKMLGYFSIVGLLRVHCLLGDFTLALKMMDNIELNKKQALFARVTACHVTTYYYVGFAYMMMRRYADAIKAFSHILVFINRTKQYHARSIQHDPINKKGEQMYALLTLCVTLCPTRLDENIHSQLREKYAEQSNKLAKPEEAMPVFEELFHFACPKFISPNGPNLDDPEVMNHTVLDPVQHYTKIFLAEVRHSLLLPTLRSYLKLYTTMGNAKLASFLEMDPEQLRTLLMMAKIRSRQIKWVEGTLLEGEYQGTSDLDFCLREDMIHVSEAKVGRRYGDWFLRNINKFQDILGGLELSTKA